MNIKGLNYKFKAAIWLTEGNGSWHFVSLPSELSKEIRELLKTEEEGWGRLKATAKTGSTEWKTSIWFDSKRNTYLLPLKAEVRKKAKLHHASEVEVELWL